MTYNEYKPRSYLSEHVESFWELRFTSEIIGENEIVFPPELSYDILFVKEPIFVKFTDQSEWLKLYWGSYFIGITSIGLTYNIPPGSSLFSIRLKPFSLANIVKIPLKEFQNTITELTRVVDIPRHNLILSIIKAENTDQKIEEAGTLLSCIIEDNCLINYELREKLNYIMRNRGNISISELYKVFYTNKLTLRHHFVNKVGLTPKEISRIWRFHNFWELLYDQPEESYTRLSLDAGYFDQSHFIRDFHSFLSSSPRHFLERNPSINISQERISKRFSGYYAPY